MLLPFLFLAAALVWAQDEAPSPQPAPGHSDGTIGLQLIAWSELQKPQPVPQQPQPVPPPDTQPSRQTPDQNAQPSQPNQDQNSPDTQQSPKPDTSESAAHTVSGTVVKVAGKYMLETDDNVAYKLDDQDKASQYDGKRVKVTGSLDRATGILHISSIELLS